MITLTKSQAESILGFSFEKPISSNCFHCKKEILNPIEIDNRPYCPQHGKPLQDKDVLAHLNFFSKGYYRLPALVKSLR